MNLRGVRESGKAFAVPVYAFMLGIVGMGVVGRRPGGDGNLPPGRERAVRAASPSPDHEAMVGIAMRLPAAARLLVRLRGPDRRRGDLQRRPRVPEAQEPQRRHDPAADGRCSPSRCCCRSSALGRPTGIKIRRATRPSSSPSTGKPVGEAYIEQTRRTPCSASWPTRSSAGFTPGRRLRVDRHRADPHPRGQHRVQRVPGARARSSPRTATCPGSCTPAATGWPSPTASSSSRRAAVALIVALPRGGHPLIQLYIVGVFVSFTLSQSGMIRHWNRHLRLETRPEGPRADDARRGSSTRVGRGDVRHRAARRPHHEVPGRRRATRSRPWSCSSSSCTASAATTTGCAEELQLDEDDRRADAARRVHAIVLVSKLHKPTLRALAYARATRPSFLEAITVDVDPEETEALQRRVGRAARSRCR